jgi:hypothetical protein
VAARSPSRPACYFRGSSSRRRGRQLQPKIGGRAAFACAASIVVDGHHACAALIVADGRRALNCPEPGRWPSLTRSVTSSTSPRGDTYLADVIPRVQDHPKRRLDELLPGPWSRARPSA